MEKAMNYLDVSPMMESLRTAPEDFSLKGKWLSHRSSRHGFAFDADGRVQIRAACECSQFLVKPEQERALYDCFRDWEASYWRPLRVNREFASHFNHHASWRRILIRLSTKFASWLAEEGSEPKGAELYTP